MSSPLIFDVSSLLASDSTVEHKTQVGPAPLRLGLDMIAIPEGRDITVDATLTPMGEGILVDADVTALLDGQCVRCLADLQWERTFHVSSFFAVSETFITIEGDEEEMDSEDDTVGVIKDETIDLLDAVTNEVGLSLPFNPVCEDGCVSSNSDVPEPDGISGEDEDDLPDPRWAGLEKFL